MLVSVSAYMGPVEHGLTSIWHLSMILEWHEQTEALKANSTQSKVIDPLYSGSRGSKLLEHVWLWLLGGDDNEEYKKSRSCYFKDLGCMWKCRIWNMCRWKRNCGYNSPSAILQCLEITKFNDMLAVEHGIPECALLVGYMIKASDTQNLIHGVSKTWNWLRQMGNTFQNVLEETQRGGETRILEKMRKNKKQAGLWIPMLRCYWLYEGQFGNERAQDWRMRIWCVFNVHIWESLCIISWNVEDIHRICDSLFCNVNCNA